LVDRQAPPSIFLRFLKFGLLAWGGPVAQIAMIWQELVEEEHWITRERFNRVLAVYQVIPGPEAHELCVYFGRLAGGRLGGLLAGLGFMFPGLLLMLALSWFYVAVGIASPVFRSVFAGCQAAVIALIVRAVHRIGGHALTDRWLWGMAVLAAAAQWAGVHFLWTLALTGAAYPFLKRGVRPMVLAACAVFIMGALVFLKGVGPVGGVPAAAAPGVSAGVSVLGLFGSGLRAGLLTVGGAYTAIPFLKHDAVEAGRWMTNAQFLDGLALSGILPAPLIIFGTFVGYVGGGLPGALAVTAGIFLPAFAFTLIGYDFMERLINNTALHGFLDGVTAGVVGLIAATAFELFRAAVTTWPALAIFGAALFALYRWRAKTVVPFVVVGAGILGFLLFRQG
jgi:chromate transporter